jgi:surface antigen
MKHTILALLAMISVGLTACETLDTGMGNKQMIGAGSGAILGGVVGSKVGKGSGQLVGVGVGTLLGLMVGNSIGKSLDQADMMYAQRAEQQAYRAPIGQQVAWNNPQSGNSGTITPVRDGKSSDGRYCREYKQTIYIDGQAQTAVGTACKNTDGTWQVLSN